MSHGDLTRGVQRSPLAIIARRRMESLGTRLNNNHMYMCTLYYTYMYYNYYVLRITIAITNYDYEFVIADGLLAGAMRSESMYTQLADDYKSGNSKKRDKKDGEFCGMVMPVCSVMWYSPLHWRSHWLWRSLLYIGIYSCNGLLPCSYSLLFMQLCN